MKPPWAALPDLEFGTIGWRMGYGESYLMKWSGFLDEVDPSYESRLAYLKEHAPAPHTWSESVYSVLYPDAEIEDYALDDEQLKEVHALGLVQSDLAYAAWRALQETFSWPWEDAKTPEKSARYYTRTLWFWSRHRRERDEAFVILPWSWRAMKPAAQGVRWEDTQSGLLMLCSELFLGDPRAPWEEGHEPSAFRDSYEENMGYAHAFR